MLLGVSCFIPFILWDFTAFYLNYFYFHLFVDVPDSTGVRLLMPADLQWLATLIQITMIGVILLYTSRAGDNTTSHVFLMLLLTLAVVMWHRGIHGNHLLWFIPLAAIHVARHRFGLIESVRSLLRR